MQPIQKKETGTAIRVYIMIGWQGSAGSAAAKHNTAAAQSSSVKLPLYKNKQQKTQKKRKNTLKVLYKGSLQLSCFVIMWFY